jgi:hypothetical protein
MSSRWRFRACPSRDEFGSLELFFADQALSGPKRNPFASLWRFLCAGATGASSGQARAQIELAQRLAFLAAPYSRGERGSRRAPSQKAAKAAKPVSGSHQDPRGASCLPSQATQTCLGSGSSPALPVSSSLRPGSCICPPLALAFACSILDACRCAEVCLCELIPPGISPSMFHVAQMRLVGAEEGERRTRKHGPE